MSQHMQVVVTMPHFKHVGSYTQCTLAVNTPL